MSPFQKNLQKVLVYFFSAISIMIVIIGIGRAKKSPTVASTAPDVSLPPEQATPNVLQGEAERQIAGTSATVAQASFSGSPYQTPWGTAVASVSVANGKITGVSMPTIPNSPPSIYAEPYLVQQALAAGSANIQGVSGATYTSIAFKSSLESAIAKANQKAATDGQPTIVSNPTTTTSATPAPSVPRSYRDDDDDYGEDDEDEDNERND
jgi:uncharacterized protein with FMN-binding domain